VKKLRVNHQALALAVKRMLQGPFTAHDVVEVTGLHINTAYELVNMFHKVGTSHRSGWEQNSFGIDTTPVFTLGPGVNKRRRKASAKEKSARYRANKKIRQQRNPLVAALHAEFYDYRGFKVVKGITIVVDHPDPYFKPEGYPNARIAHGMISRFITSRGLDKLKEQENGTDEQHDQQHTEGTPGEDLDGVR
jgi:hypothetical protein